MAEHITPGVLERIQNAPDGDEVMQSQPVVQVLSIKPIAPGGAQPGQQERFRIIISDGQNYAQSMLATQLNGIVHSGSVGKQSVIRMTQFTVNTVRDKRCATCLVCSHVVDTESSILQAHHHSWAGSTREGDGEGGQPSGS
jgi:replication factor A1